MRHGGSARHPPAGDLRHHEAQVEAGVVRHQALPVQPMAAQHEIQSITTEQLTDPATGIERQHGDPAAMRVECRPVFHLRLTYCQATVLVDPRPRARFAMPWERRGLAVEGYQPTMSALVPLELADRGACLLTGGGQGVVYVELVPQHVGGRFVGRAPA